MADKEQSNREFREAFADEIRFSETARVEVMSKPGAIIEVIVEEPPRDIEIEIDRSLKLGPAAAGASR